MGLIPGANAEIDGVMVSVAGDLFVDPNHLRIYRDAGGRTTYHGTITADGRTSTVIDE